VPQLVELKAARPLASGAYRDVFQHPGDEGLLIKVIKPLFAEREARRANWFEKWQGLGAYKSLLREIEKYLVLRERGQHDLSFIQHFAGIVETDLGLGMVVRKVRGRDGGLAPTLTEIVRARGLDPDLVARIGALRDDVIRHHVVFGDISANNIVEAADAEHGHRLVIIDGLSDRLWLPVNSLSLTFYRAYCDRRFARMMDMLHAIDRSREAPMAVAAGGGKGLLQG
jgi:hypothetical protein